MRLSSDACLACEDSENSLKAARAAGLKTIVTVNDYAHGQDFTGAAIVLDHIGAPGLSCRALAGALPGGMRYFDLASAQRLHALG